MQHILFAMSIEEITGACLAVIVTGLPAILALLKIRELHILVNSRMTELTRSIAAASHSEGKAEGVIEGREAGATDASQLLEYAGTSAKKLLDEAAIKASTLVTEAANKARNIINEAAEKAHHTVVVAVVDESADKEDHDIM